MCIRDSIEGLPFRLRDLLQEQETLPEKYVLMQSSETQWNYVNEDTLVLRLPEEMNDRTELERIFRDEYGIKPVSMQ